MRGLNLLLLLLGLCLTSGLKAAGKTVLKIGSHPIPGLVIDSQTGLLVDFIRAAAKEAGIEIEISVHPVKRIIEMFAHRDIDGYFPANPLSTPKNSLLTNTIYNKRIFAFSHSTKLLITEEQLKGKSVGRTLGYSYGTPLKQNTAILWETAKEDSNNFQKLEKRRIDAVVCEEFSGLSVIESLKMTDVVYDANKPLAVIPSSMALQPQPGSEALIASLNVAMKKLTDAGLREKLIQIYFPHILMQRETLKPKPVATKG